MKNIKFSIFTALFALIFSVHIHSSKAMDVEDKTPITFIQSDSTKMVIKVNLNQTLSDLRSELVSMSRMVPGDVFQQEGRDIFRDDEKDWKIREVIKDNTLSLKLRDSLSSYIFGDIKSPPQKVDASKHNKRYRRRELPRHWSGYRI